MFTYSVKTLSAVAIIIDLLLIIKTQVESLKRVNGG